jgi:hypothetical protein
MLRVNFIVCFGVWEEDEAILMVMGLDDWRFGEAVPLEKWRGALVGMTF